MLKPFALAFLLIGAPCWLRSAQSPQKSWDNLRQLRAGEGIEVVDAKMKSHRGAFATYTQEGISLRQAHAAVVGSPATVRAASAESAVIVDPMAAVATAEVVTAAIATAAAATATADCIPTGVHEFIG